MSTRGHEQEKPSTVGDEIERRYFDAEDFSEFRKRLDEETALADPAVHGMASSVIVAMWLDSSSKGWLVDETG